MTDSNTRARQLLAQAGTALYGEHWQSPLARALGIRQDSVRGWVSGKNARFDLSHPVWEKIAVLIREQRRALAVALDEIGEAVPDA